MNFVIRGCVVAMLFALLATSGSAQSDSVKLPQSGEAKQGTKCILDFKPAIAADTPRMNLHSLPSGKYDAFIGGRAIWSCRGENITLLADSAEYYGDRDLLYLIGNVSYRESRAKIDAQHMTYWTVDGHLLAEGDVYAVTEKGATLRGPVADYYRAVPGIRTSPSLAATGRPKLAMPQVDSATGEVKDTIHMTADRITSENDSLIYAAGKVEIDRTEFRATGDSAFFDQGSGRAKLMLNPVVNAAQKDRPFTLKGGVIDIFSTNKKVDRVVASPDGEAVSNDLQLFADSIDMRIQDNQLNRAMAWGKTRARAESPSNTIIADSIDAIMPNQRVRELHAIGNAYATTVPDTNTITTDERDWMRGDTVIAYFDSIPAAQADSNATPPIKTIISSVDAKAYYHLRNNDGVKDKPGVNYVRGREINIDFADRQVQTVTVVDQATGVYLEAETDSAARGTPGSPSTTPAPGTKPTLPKTPESSSSTSIYIPSDRRVRL